MSPEKNLVKELNNELRKDRVILFFKTHLVKIVLLVVAIVIIAIALTTYNFLMENKAKKNSIVFAKVQDEFSTGKVENAIKLLDALTHDGTNGYQFIAYMSKANIAVQKGQLKKAVEIIKTAEEKVSLPKYYKDMLTTMVYILRINSDEDTKNILTDLSKDLHEKDDFYYFKLEIYASALFMNKQYKESLASYEKIINGKNVPQDLQERALRAKGLLVGYVK